MTIQKKLEAHISNDDDMPQGVVSLESESGSFDLPEGVQMSLRKCTDITCSSSEGRNELSLSECDSVTIKDFKNGVIRLEKCDQVEEITCTEGTTLTVSASKITKADCKNATVIMIDCEIEDGKFEDCEITSIKNKFQKVELTGGVIQSEDDEFQDECTFTDLKSATIVNGEFKGKITGDGSVFHLHAVKSEDEVKLTDCNFTDVTGEYKEKFTVDGDKSTCMLKGTKIDEKVEITDGSLMATALELKEELTVTGSIVSLTDLKAEKEVTIEKSQVVITGGEFNDKTTITSCSARLLSCKFSDDVTIEKGATDSEKNEFEKKLELTGGTIESKRDKFSDDVTLTDLIAKSLIFEPKEFKKLDIRGKDSSSLLEIIGGTGEDITVDTLGNLRVFKTTFEKVDLTNVKLCNLVEITATETKVEECGTVITDDGDLGGTVSFKLCGTVIANNTNGQDTTIEDCGQYLGGEAKFQTVTIKKTVLGVTKECSDLTLEDSALIDNGSTIKAVSAQIIGIGSTVESADTSVINALDSTITCDSSMVTARGGTVDAGGDSTVTISGGDVMNFGGYTSGTGFNYEDQGGSTLFDGINTTLACTVGNVNIDALIGSIYGTALENIGMTAEVGIGLTAGEGIIADAMTDISLIAGALISADATTMEVTVASVYDVQSSGLIALTASTAISLDAAAVGVNGAIITLN